MSKQSHNDKEVCYTEYMSKKIKIVIGTILLLLVAVLSVTIFLTVRCKDCNSGPFNEIHLAPPFAER